MKDKRNTNDIAYVAIPQSVENLTLPDPELLNYYKNLEERTFWIDSEINNYSLELVKYILQWNRDDKGIPPEDRKPIKLFFFSPGGSLDVYRTISEVIRLSVTPIIGINIGIAYSAAAMIFCACHKKLMLKTSSILLHKGSCSNMSGTYDEIYAAMVEYEKQINELITYVKQVSNYTEEEVEAKIGTDWYISADEALEHGICDQIIECIGDII